MKNTKIVPNAKGDGNLLLLVSAISAAHNGKKTEHKDVLVFDRIAPHVGWKIAQVLRAIGIKKPPKKMTLKELLKLITKYKDEFRAVIGKSMYNGQPQNPVLQYLPLESSKDEDDDDIDEDDEDSDDEDDDEDEDEDDDDDESGDDDEDEEDDDDDDDDDDDEDEDEDEDEDDDDDSSSKKSKSKKVKKKKAKR
ncbi:MAG: hypothetical protein LC663_05125 [Actinobacteria bacterium]|nr:hypothetical protein [Actinomycetota bacterium]